jgi:predicted flap endonuclease-1-like 5' DNA nuclease
MNAQFQHGSGNGKGTSHPFRLTASDLADKSHWPDKKRNFLAFAEKEGYRPCLENPAFEYNLYPNYLAGNFNEAVQMDKLRADRHALFAKANYDLIILCDDKFSSMIRRHELANPQEKPRLIWNSIVHRMEEADEPALRSQRILQSYMAIKMKTSGNLVLNFDDFIADLQRIEQLAAQNHVQLSEELRNIVLTSGLPPSMDQAQITATVQGAAGYDAYVTALRLAVTRQATLQASRKSKREEADDHVENETTKIKGLTSHLNKALKAQGIENPNKIAQALAATFSNGNNFKFKSGGGGGGPNPRNGTSKWKKDGDGRKTDKSSYNGGGDKRTGKGKKGKGCWDCGELGHRAGDSKCKNPKRTHLMVVSPISVLTSLPAKHRPHHPQTPRPLLPPRLQFSLQASATFAPPRTAATAHFSAPPGFWPPSGSYTFPTWPHHNLMMRIAPGLHSLVTSARIDLQLWVIDSGASASLSPVRSNFISLEPCSFPSKSATEKLYIDRHRVSTHCMGQLTPFLVESFSFYQSGI